MLVNYAGKMDSINFVSKLRATIGITNERIYILPTWYCLLFNFTLLLFFFASFFLSSPLLFGLVAFLLFIQLLSMIESHVNLREITVSGADDLVVESRSTQSLGLKIISRERSFGIGLKILGGSAFPQTKIGGKTSVAIRKIVLNELIFSLTGGLRKGNSDFNDFITAASYESMVRLPFEAAERGVHRLPSVIVSSLFPLGLFRAVKIIHFKESYFAYPKPTQMTVFSDGRSGVQAHGPSSRNVNPVIGADEYLNHREFKMGDSLRRIDWRASSRRGIKIVKEFGYDDSSGNLVIRWQDAMSADLEEKLSEMSAGVMEVSNLGCKFGIELPGFKTTFGSGQKHVAECLRCLAAYDTNS